jgi:hypothetical protein
MPFVEAHHGTGRWHGGHTTTRCKIKRSGDLKIALVIATETPPIIGHTQFSRTGNDSIFIFPRGKRHRGLHLKKSPSAWAEGLD